MRRPRSFEQDVAPIRHFTVSGIAQILRNAGSMYATAVSANCTNANNANNFRYKKCFLRYDLVRMPPPLPSSFPRPQFQMSLGGEYRLARKAGWPEGDLAQPADMPRRHDIIRRVPTVSSGRISALRCCQPPLHCSERYLWKAIA